MGSWPLAELRDVTANCAIATGVFKPVYDCAYVRLLDGESGIDGPAQVVGGAMQFGSKIISMVLRPELNGWRVHGYGQPLDPHELPRTWNVSNPTQ